MHGVWLLCCLLFVMYAVSCKACDYATPLSTCANSGSTVNTTTVVHRMYNNRVHVKLSKKTCISETSMQPPAIQRGTLCDAARTIASTLMSRTPSSSCRHARCRSLTNTFNSICCRHLRLSTQVITHNRTALRLDGLYCCGDRGAASCGAATASVW